MSTPLERLDDRYRNDPEFHAVVDVMLSVILKLQMTPAEIREAAMYAALRAETLFPTPLRIELGREDGSLRSDLLARGYRPVAGAWLAPEDEDVEPDDAEGGG